MAELNCVVLTPDRKIYEDKVEEIVIQTYDGKIGILPGHAALVSRLGLGPLKLKKNGSDLYFMIEGGFLEVSNNQVIVLAESASLLEELNKDEIAAELDGLLKAGMPSGALNIERYNIDIARCKEKLKILEKQ